MERQSLSLMLFVFAFGLLLGAALLVNFNYFHNENQNTNENNPRTQFASGTARLDAYRCKRSETKQIIMGGIEDDFDPVGDENVDVFPNQNKYFFDSGSMSPRNFDEGGQNKIFSHKMDISGRTYHGILALRVKELSSVLNDALSIYPLDAKSAERDTSDYFYQVGIAEMSQKDWKFENGYFWTNLSDLPIAVRENDKIVQKSHIPHLLAVIKQQTLDQDIIIRIGDDTQVDFVGAALCLEPEQNLGTVYSSKNIYQTKPIEDLPSDMIFLSYGIVDGKVCGVSGCRHCDTEIPVACINDQNHSMPSEVEHLGVFWSGGDLAFSKPVPASRFVLEDDVDDFCRTSFGEGWRLLNIKDGSWNGTILGYGKVPSAYDEYWVGVKNSAHLTCWEKRQDYSKLQVTEDE